MVYWLLYRIGIGWEGIKKSNENKRKKNYTEINCKYILINQQNEIISFSLSPCMYVSNYKPNIYINSNFMKITISIDFVNELRDWDIFTVVLFIFYALLVFSMNLIRIAKEF